MSTSFDDGKDRSLSDAPALAATLDASVIPELAGKALLEEELVTRLDNTPRPVTTKKELWSYYLYYVGCTGIGPYNFASTQFQNLIYLAGYDPAVVPPTPGNCTDACVIHWGGKPQPTSSVVLDVSGISFAAQLLVFLLLGSFSDYGQAGRWVLFGSTFLSCLIGLCWITVRRADQWQAALALFVIGGIAYNLAFSFFVAAHSKVARDLPEAHESEEKVLEGLRTPAEHVKVDEKLRGMVGSMSNFVCDVGAVLTLVVAIGILKAVHSDASTEDNTFSYSVIIAYSSTVWVVTAIPWFIWEQRRPAQILPRGTTYLTVGLKNVWQAVKEVRRLKQAFLYLVAYFIIGDALGTAASIEGILQNEIIEFNNFQYNLISILGFGTQGIGMIAIWFAVNKLKWSQKAIVLIIAYSTALVCGWGFIGIWTKNFGFKTRWEVWVFQAVWGILVSPWYQMSLNMISDVVPAKKMYLFFSLFGILGKTSSFVGPFITARIIASADGNDNMAFAFLLPAVLVGIVVLHLVSVPKARIESKLYMEWERRELYEACGQCVGAMQGAAA